MTTQAVEEKIEEQQNQQVPQTQAQSVELSEATNSKTTGAGTSIDVLLDVSVPIMVTVGRTEIPIQQFLQLGLGSVLKLNKSIDAPADLFLKDIRFATGNIVVVDGKFAVRIKEIFGTDNPATPNKK